MSPTLRYRLSQEENELLRRLRITKNLQIVLKKLQLKQLVQNINKQIKIKVWACSMSKCNYFSNQRSIFNDHKKLIHSSKKPFKCHICKYVTKGKSSFTFHMRTRTKDYYSNSLISCPFCNYMARNKSFLNLHLRRHTGEKPYKCPHCDYQVSTSCNFTRHVNSRHKKINKPKKCICQFCSKAFASKSQLFDHILRHTGERPFSCQYCKRGFTNKGKNIRHENICMLNPRQSDPTWVASQKSFKCHMCDYSARENYKLKMHLLKTHSESKQFKCDYEYCDYETSIKGNLKRHERYHTGKKPFKCSACNRSFVSSSDLRIHGTPCQRKQDLLKIAQATSHFSTSINMPFKCDSLYCDVAFKTKCGLKQHLNSVHSDSHPYKRVVPGCRKSFTAKNRYQLHITTHSSKLK